MALKVIDILETIRDNASDDYIARVPAYNLENLSQVGKEITSDKNIMNEFITTLINKIALSNIISKMYHNPIEKLKSAGVPFGSTIEEIFVNPATDVGYQKDGSYLLKTTTPDGKTAYYGQNRQSSYPTSITEAQLNKAFTSESEFMSFYNVIISSLYSGDNIDEFTLFKRMLGKSIDEGTIKIVASDLSDTKALIKDITNHSKYFTFPNTAYCGYNNVNSAKIAAGETPCITFCNTDDQVFLVRADVETEINFEYFASIFNIDIVKLRQMTIVVDDIPSESADVYAVLCDKESIQIRDNVFKIETFYNGSNLTWNIWLHHWQFIFLSMFGNFVGFGKAKKA